MARSVLRSVLIVGMFVLVGIGMFAVGLEVQSIMRSRSVTSAPAPTSVPSPAPSASPASDFDVFWEAWGIIRAEFIGKLPDDKQMTYAAIRGVVDSLGDQHTAFTDPSRAALLESSLSGSYEGIGATVEQKNGQLVVNPMKGRAAEKAGLLAGDILFRINGESTDGFSVTDAVTRIRGPRDTQVTLTVMRQGASGPIDITITRATIATEAVSSRMLDNGIAYLQLNEFTGSASKEVDDALKTLLAGNPKGIVLDLRSNPGGYLQSAIEIASEFIGSGVILSEEDKDGKRTVHQALPGGRATKLPMAVLVDKGSASASEILAGAIKDRGRGILVGETTFGKGSVQVSHKLSDDSRLTVTIRHWLTPSGKDIHGQGIDPDYPVPFPESERKGGRDPQLERAVQYLVTGK